MSTYFEEYKTAQIRADMLADHLHHTERELIDLKIRLDSLCIKWHKRGNSACVWDDAIEDLLEEYLI